MSNPQNAMKGLIRPIRILVPIIGLILTYYLTTLYRINSFPDAGEAYMKGEGHILSEDFTKGIIFLISLHFVAAVFLFSLVFLLTSPLHRTTFFRILNKVALIALGILIVYIVYKLFDIYSNGYYDQSNRVIEISITWILRIAGMYVAYFLLKSKRSYTTMHVS